MSSSAQLLQDIEQVLIDRFDLGQLNYFFDVGVKQDFDAGSSSMRQTKFANYILEKFKMDNSNLDRTPQVSSFKLT